MRSKKVKPILLILIVIGLLGFLIIKKNTPSDIKEIVETTLKKCTASTNTLNSLDPDCVFTNFEKTISVDNFGEAVNFMQELFSNVNDSKKLGITSCHIPAHIAGEVAYEKGATFNQVLEVCNLACSSGCLHGAFQAMFKESGKNLIEHLSESCSILKSPTDSDVRACWHIVGHGVGEYYGLDINSSIKACEALPFEKQRWHCMSGLRMEHVTPSPRNSETLPQTTIDSYLDLCAKFPNNEGYRDDCYSESAFAVNKLYTNSELAIEICNRIPNDPIVRKRCAGGGGHIFFFAHKDDPLAIYEFCNKYKNKGMIRDCITGAIENTTIERRYETTGHKLCRLVEKDFTKECFSFMGETIERHANLERRETQCSKLLDEEKLYCLTKPQDLRTYYLPPN